MSLPIGDMTPDNFIIKPEHLKEKLKKIVRRRIYPIYLKLKQSTLSNKYKEIKDIGFDELFLGQRGNDYEAHRRRVNKIKSIKDSTVLILGIGTGRDLESWLKFKPKKIIAVDFFNYEKAFKYKKLYSDNFQKLKMKYQEKNLMVSGMTVIYAKK